MFDFGMELVAAALANMQAFNFQHSLKDLQTSHLQLSNCVENTLFYEEELPFRQRLNKLCAKVKKNLDFFECEQRD